VGGAEHSVLHLLYARFWHKVLYDCGLLDSKEPFQKLVHQGMILGELEYTGYKKEDEWISADAVEGMENVQTVKITEDDIDKKDEEYVLKGTDIRINAKAHKMSKSRGNVINPDDIINEYGADSMRLYEMFMGPLDQVKPWNTNDVDGVYRFLGRVWRLVIDEETGQIREEVTNDEPSQAQLKTLHECIQKVSEDVEGLSFNTAISAMMIFVNEANKWEQTPQSVLESFLKLLSPFAPHLAEELWQRLGHEATMAYAPWPEFNEQYLASETQTYPVQVNGKVRANIEVATEKAKDKEVVMELAKEAKNVQRYLKDKNIIKEIFVPGQIINFVVK
jgi:leucyl-tRNA synthetase